MATVYFDVATNRWHADKATGIPPRLLRLAWAIDDYDPTCLLIQLPDGEAIEPTTARYHLATADVLDERGYPPTLALGMFHDAVAGAAEGVAFNLDYHWRQMQRALKDAELAWAPSTLTCVMKAATGILAIPLMRPGGGLKSPSLTEACAHYGLVAPTPEGDPVRYGADVVAAVRDLHRVMTGASE